MTRHRLLPAAFAVVLAASTLSATAAPKSCAVWTKGPWTTIQRAHFEDVGTGFTIAPLTHILSFTYGSFFAGGQRVRTFDSDGFTVARTVDGGCSWQSTYSLDPLAVPSDTADPARVLPMADPEYGLKAFAAAPYRLGAVPKAGQDTVVVFAQHGDAFTGLALLATGQPAFVARSADGGATWRTDVFAAKLDGAPAATPVLGNGLNAPYVAVSAVDTRSVFVIAETRDPRAIQADPTAVGWRALYVSRDGGATWTFVAPTSRATGLAADPGDPNTAWVSIDGATAADRLLAVDTRTGATRTVFTAPPEVSVRGVDVTGGPGRSTRLVLTATQTNSVTRRPELLLYTSLDTGRHWTRVTSAAGLWMTPVGTARITERGDLLIILEAGTAGVGATGLFRWSAATRRWTVSSFGAVPLPKGCTGFQADGLVPVEASHRYFLIPGVANGMTGGLLAIYDSEAGR